MLGLTACKLELALVPSVISIAGRMLTGDDDTDMELFLFQIGIFVAPVIPADDVNTKLTVGLLSLGVNEHETFR